MTDYFSEKAQQVEPGAVEAFGIKLTSRYGKAHELVQLLNFAQQAACASVAHYIKEVFYDSKASICTFTLDSAVREHDPVAERIHAAASETLNQFELFGDVHFRNGLEVEDEA